MQLNTTILAVNASRYTTLATQAEADAVAEACWLADPVSTYVAVADEAGRYRVDVYDEDGVLVFAL